MLVNDIGDKEFHLFKDLIYREAGIKLSDLKKSLLQARLSRRCRFLAIPTFNDYYNFLMENYDEEKIHFINAITTNKTEFFRENRHFEYMRDIFLPEFESRNKREIRIWSAGCSTGEEPYSAAITLMEYYENRKNPVIKILATDIDTNVLQTAARGIYRKEVVENIELPVLKKYFLRGKGENSGLFSVRDDLKKMIYFRRLNLMQEHYPMKGPFDIIFCRNVIIYFDKETQVNVFKRFHRYLDDRGCLFIGHSENITTITDDFVLKGNTIYAKAGEGKW